MLDDSLALWHKVLVAASALGLDGGGHWLLVFLAAPRNVAIPHVLVGACKVVRRQWHAMALRNSCAICAITIWRGYLPRARSPRCVRYRMTGCGFVRE